MRAPPATSRTAARHTHLQPAAAQYATTIMEQVGRAGGGRTSQELGCPGVGVDDHRAGGGHGGCGVCV